MLAMIEPWAICQLRLNVLSPELVDADGDAVEVEIRHLAVGGRAQVGPAVGAECENVHDLGVVGVVDAVSERLLGDHRVDDASTVPAVDHSAIGWIDMAVQETRDVVAVVDPHELAAQWIAVTVLDEDLFADAASAGIEIHGQVLTVEGQARQRYTLGAAGLGNLNRGRVRDDLGRVPEGLLGIPELDTANLGGVLNGQEDVVGVGDPEDTADRLNLLRVPRPATDGPVDPDQRDVFCEESDRHRFGMALPKAR